MSDFYETTVRVRYAETDSMGVVHHANFLIWFEVGRVETFRQMGFTYKEMEEGSDSYAMVVEARCRYKKPAYYDDVVRIRTRVAESRRRSLRFGYEILRDATGEVLATGETIHVICDGQGRAKALPEQYRKYFPLTQQPDPDPVK